MALDHIDWPPDDPRWFWMLFRPADYYNGQRKVECLECFKLILARCGPHLRAAEHGQSMLHRAIERDHGIGVELATILLDAGARLDIRDKILLSTPLGWACRWGRVVTLAEACLLQIKALRQIGNGDAIVDRPHVVDAESAVSSDNGQAVAPFP